MCLGDSATANYVQKDGVYKSWPLLVEEKLNQLGKNIEVNNCAQGGFNTNEVLIKFLINHIDAEPDVVVLYHAFVNIRGYLTDNFERDFFHFRRTLPFNYSNKVAVARCIPTFNSWVIRYLVGEYFSYLNIKEDLIRSINRNEKINRLAAPQGLEVFKRNLETLIYVCKGRGIKLIMSTYCYYLYPEISSSEIHQKFYKILQDENDIIRHLSFKHNILLVDNACSVPLNKQTFQDEVHPTFVGMELIAYNFYCAINSILREEESNGHS